MATRIEMRSPNPYTNTYLAIAAFYISMLDGIKACVESGKTLKEMENELSKKAGDEGFTLKKTENTAASMTYLKTTTKKNAPTCLANRRNRLGKHVRH